MIGFALDQQVTVQKAFSGPAELKRRLGHLDAARIAAMDPAELDAVFRERPAIHRFPGLDGRQGPGPVRRDRAGLRQRCPRESGPRRADGPALEARLLGLPGIGEMKAKSIIAVLGKRFGVRPPGYDAVAPTWPTLGDVDSPEALAATRPASAPTRRRCGPAEDSFPRHCRRGTVRCLKSLHMQRH